jgi:hypothetical protein
VSEVVVPWATLTTPDELEEWIADGDDRLDQAWEDHDNGVGKKWLIAAVEPDQFTFIATDELKTKTYPVGEDNWGEGAAQELEEWVLGCLSDLTGLEGELVSGVPIEFGLDEGGRLCEISGFAVLALEPETNVMTTWLANFDGFGDDDEGDGWWLEFAFDGSEQV